MKAVLSIITLMVLLIMAGLSAWRWMDHRADRSLWNRLAAMQPGNPPEFDPAMVAGLPEIVRRYFTFTIKAGTPLYPVAEISMRGLFGPGDKEAPDYLPMVAEQILAAPTGFVWKMSAKRGLLRLSGSDTHLWSRFWLMGMVPVARLGGTADHARSAFGRYIAEAAFWTPAALLPGPGIIWEAVGEDIARVRVTRGAMSQMVELSIGADGRPLHVRFSRWSNANLEKRYRPQPFGGFLSRFQDFEGFRLPTHIEAGNHFGTRAYFPFFVADITRIRFAAVGGAR